MSTALVAEDKAARISRLEAELAEAAMAVAQARSAERTWQFYWHNVTENCRQHIETITQLRAALGRIGLRLPLGDAQDAESAQAYLREGLNFLHRSEQPNYKVYPDEARRVVKTLTEALESFAAAGRGRKRIPSEQAVKAAWLADEGDLSYERIRYMLTAAYFKDGV